jgi:lipid-A-disaccharide synthase
MDGKVRVFVSANERSGDAHAAALVGEVRRRRPDVEFEGFGGEMLREAGCHIHEDLISAASMGLHFVAHFRRFVRAIRTFDRLLDEALPAAVLLVDSPGFNFVLARLAHWRGVPVVYYICPQIWAWAPWRRPKVLKYTDLLLTILPFEEGLYRNPDVPVVSVGHPLGDSLSRFSPKAGEALRARLRIPGDSKVISFLPGSREHEVKDLMPLFRKIIDGMELAGGSHRLLISACQEALRASAEEALFGCRVPHEVLADDARAIAQASDLVLVASGTASLEVAYFEKPMLVLYNAGGLRRLMFDLYSVTPYFSLPNILGASLLDGEPLVYERLCAGGEASEIVAVAKSLLEEGPERAQAIARLQRLKAEKDQVFAPGSAARAADAFLEFLQGC